MWDIVWCFSRNGVWLLVVIFVLVLYVTGLLEVLSGWWYLMLGWCSTEQYTTQPCARSSCPAHEVRTLRMKFIRTQQPRSTSQCSSHHHIRYAAYRMPSPQQPIRHNTSTTKHSTTLKYKQPLPASPFSSMHLCYLSIMYLFSNIIL